MNLSRNPHARHRTAGVDAEVFADYAVGQRVMTPEGIPGTVSAVLDGPLPGTETYEVVLDEGLGGGQYSTGELLAIEGHEASADGEPIGGEYVVPGLDPDPTKRLASEDYPELAEILVERPPLAHAEPMAMHATKTATTQLTCPDCGASFVGDGVGASHGCQPRVEQEQVTAALDEDLDFAMFEGEDTGYNPARGGDPMLGEDEADEPTVIATEAGLWDSIVAPVVDRATRHIDQHYPGIEQGTVWSYDWCRFRRDRHCYFPREMDLPATQQAGYVVWKPLDRGICGRDKWEHQRMCPVSEPGPNSGEPLAKVDATVPWSEGGQRGVVFGGLAQADRDHIFEFTAAWADVRRKASEIRRSGGVRVVSIVGERETGRVVTAEVRGDTNIYETSVQSEPGRSNVAMWTCGCPWAAYSWGRSGRWKKYEGRMCSHALALSYETQSKRLMEQADAPWDSGQVRRPGDYDPDAQRYSSKVVAAVGWREVHTDGYLATAPAVWIAHAMLTEGAKDQEVVAAFGPHIHAEAKVLDFNGRLRALVRGVVKTVKEIITETGQALLTDGTTVPVRDLTYPTYHPTRGLTASLEAELREEPEPALPQTTGDEEDDADADRPEDAEQQAQDPDEGSTPQDLPQDGVQAHLALSTDPHSWLLSGSSQDNSDIAEAARTVLAKQAVKAFTPAEQAEIIGEGEDQAVMARNLDALDLEGTHYLGLEDALSQDDDESWLD